MILKTLIICLLLTTSVLAQENISDFSDKSVTVLNEELRKIRNTYQSKTKAGTFTRDLSLASGTLSITGLGFKPYAVIFIAAGGVIGQKWASWGFSDGTTDHCITDNGNVTADTYVFENNCISLYTGANPDRQVAVIKSFDDDGFTLTWTKTGVPTGTANIGYIAFKKEIL